MQQHKDLVITFAPSMNLINPIITLYSLGLLAWFMAYLIWGDHWAWLSLLNMFAFYMFIPLPFVSILLFSNNQRWLLWLLILNWIILIGLWGKLFLPKISISAHQPPLRILTYNVLGYNPASMAQIETIRQANADVVMLQELNTELGLLIARELHDQYPYQILDAEVGVDGMGTLSKFPLRRVGVVADLGWVGRPQWLELDWNGCLITLFNFHMAPTNSFAFDHVQETNRLRQEEARWLVNQLPLNQPAILAGDSNSAPLSDSYRILTRSAEDAWLVSGWGLGHTFPGRSGPGSSRPEFLGLAVPKWLLRIDYIFSTPPLRASSAHLAPFDGVSDHRGLIAELILTERNK